MKKSHIQVLPSVLYFPESNERTIHEIYVNNKSVNHFLCINILTTATSTFKIEPSTTITIPPFSSKRLVMIKKENAKSIKNTDFHFTSRFIKNIFDLPVSGWNKSRLFDVRLKTTNKKSKIEGDYDIKTSIQEDETVMTIIKIKPEKKKEKVLLERDFSRVKVFYGIKPNQKHTEREGKNRSFFRFCNKWNLNELYLIENENNEKQMITKDHTNSDVIQYYCPNCYSLQKDLIENSFKEEFSRCQKCAECPICQCNLSITKENNTSDYCYFCYSCNWTSTSSLKHKITGKTVDELSNKLLSIGGEIEEKVHAKFMDKILDKYSKMSKTKGENFKNFIKLSRGDYEDEKIKNELGGLIHIRPKKVQKLTIDKNTVSVSNLIKNPDPLTKLFAEKTFSYQKILSAQRRTTIPGYSSIIKRDLPPRRKKILTKKQRKYENEIIVKPYFKDGNVVNSLDFIPNYNASKILPQVKVVYFDRMVLNNESRLYLKFYNPANTPITLKLHQYKKLTKSFDSILSLPFVDFKVLGKESDPTVAKKLEETEKENDERKEFKEHFENRNGNSLLLKIGITPKNPKVEIVRIAIRVVMNFEISGKSFSQEMILRIHLGKLFLEKLDK